MSDESQPPNTTPTPEDTSISTTVRDRLSNQAFAEWYQEQQIEENILNGQAYFNGPSPPKDPERHSPSKLLQCHRKAMYDRRNAPNEGTPPEGLFWIGSEFEEQVIVPFLQDEVTTDNTYVQNSVWIDTELTIDDATVRVRVQLTLSSSLRMPTRYSSRKSRPRKTPTTCPARNHTTKRSSTRICTRLTRSTTTKSLTG